MKITFTVPGEPVAKARARAGRYGFYTPKKTKQFEEKVKIYYKKNSNFYFDKKFLKLEVSAFFEIPKSYKGSKLKSILSGKYFPTKKDWDNVGKAVSDALNKTAYDDDRYVVDARVKKLYCIEGDSPRVEITLEEIT